MTLKIEAVVGDATTPFDYGNTLMREGVPGRERLCLGVSHDQDRYVLGLAGALTGRCQILYILHTTRTGAQLGRYESPEMELEDVRRFFARFGRYFSEDSRHDVWLHSVDDDATMVLDRHNLIYAYGPIDEFERLLLKAGIRNAPVPQIQEHVHNYHPEWDEHEKAILETIEWTVGPLQKADVQRPR